MHSIKKETSLYKDLVSTLITKSEKEIEKTYIQYDEIKAKDLYLQVLGAIKIAVLSGDTKNLKKLGKLSAAITNVKDQATLRTFYDSDDNPIKDTNLVLLACKHKKKEILKHIFSNQSKILNNLSVDIGVPFTPPDDKDDECHNSFYYAIRADDVELFDTLLKQWPHNYFENHLEELDEILSKTYEEIKLKNIQLSDKMKISVETELINFRFFSDVPGDDYNTKPSFDNIKERINLVVENIAVLVQEYSCVKKVDEKFLFIAKFIARNIHILKRQLKPTYDKLPWEEIEFCLIAFIKSKITRQNINLVCISYLTKEIILKHLNNFACKLNEIEISNCNKSLPSNLIRKKVVKKIIDNYFPFSELYNDYENVVSVYSLDKIHNYIGRALEVNPEDEKGHLVISRALQVTGEYLKDSLESPKLSSLTSELLVLSAPKNTKEILTELRDSLSHGDSLSKRIEIEENDDGFFTKVQNDLKKIYVTISHLLRKSEAETCRRLIRKFVNNRNLNEVKELAQEICILSLDEIPFKPIEIADESVKTIEELISELSSKIREKTDYEQSLFNKIDKIIYTTTTSNKPPQFGMKFGTGISLLKELAITLSNDKVIGNSIEVKETFAKKALGNICPDMKPQGFMEIAEILVEVTNLVKPRLEPGEMNETIRIIHRILFMFQFEVNNIEWVELLREKLPKNKRRKFNASRKFKQEKTKSVLDEKQTKQLKMKLSTLENLLNSNQLNDQLIVNYSLYKKNKKLQAAVEMLIQDILSIFESSGNLTQNHFFLDDNCPLLVGKALRNYLAHGNALIDILLSDPLLMVILNAKKLMTEKMLNNKKYIGKFIKNDLSRLKNKYDYDLQIIENQQTMFTALEEGHVEEIENCTRKGADTNARTLDLWTSLHFAAKGTELKIVESIFNKDLIAKNVNGESPLHVAAAYGRKDIVEFFIKKNVFEINDGNYDNRTLLHIAAYNGHKDIVEISLKNGALTTIKDIMGFMPVHYAISNNQVNVAIFLFDQETNINTIESAGGCTPLHLAARYGYLELVGYFLEHKSNVNAKANNDWTPIYEAAANGHSEVVRFLISEGATVNIKLFTDSRTPLHFAAENGHENVVKTLVENGANVNDVDKIYNYAPLHYAAMNGYIEIVEILLRNKADVNVASIESITPLHFATQCGHRQIADLLIKSKAFINAKTDCNLTALHISSCNGFKSIVELLIEKGAEIDFKGTNNCTPLMGAAEIGNIDIVKYLIFARADIASMDIFGLTALHLSCMNGHLDVTKVLVENRKADVNAKTIGNFTPLHLASEACSFEKIRGTLLKDAVENIDGIGEKIAKYLLTIDNDASVKIEDGAYKEIVNFLLDKGADIHAKNENNSTPLHMAVCNNVEIVEALIKGDAKVNVKDKSGRSPLHLAIMAKKKKVVKMLIKNGADIDTEDCYGLSPLTRAIRLNYEDIAILLIEKGAKISVSADIKLAILNRQKNVFNTLLNNKEIHNQISENKTLLHLAAKYGLKSIIEKLISKGADVNALDDNHLTPLHVAARKGQKEIVELLLEKGAKEDSTPLYVAAVLGPCSVVEDLLRNNANTKIKDNISHRAIDLAIIYGHLKVVKQLIQHNAADSEYKSSRDYASLHLASYVGNLEITRYLIDAGADFNAQDSLGLKSIHIAALNGHKNVVEFFLHNGCKHSILGTDNWTLLHYAAEGGKLEMVKYLVEQNADVNATSCNGSTPMHVASENGHFEVIKYLLSNGAFYDAADEFNRKPLNVTKHENIINLLSLTENLFRAVDCNNPMDVEKNIKAGAVVNARNLENAMPLHNAVRNGCKRIVDILLRNEANPNAVENGDFTPLHLAAQCSHSEIVRGLLSNGAIYNGLTHNNETPLILTDNKDNVKLLKLLDRVFEMVRNRNLKLVIDLKQIQDNETMKVVMNSRNREGRTLIVAAIRNNFPNIEQLKQILLQDVVAEICEAQKLFSRQQYEDALRIYQNILATKKKVLASDNPCILDIQNYIAQVLCRVRNNEEALNMLHGIYHKRKEILGENDRGTLRTRSTIALVLHQQGKNKDALGIYREIDKVTKEILGTLDSDTLEIQVQTAHVLNELKEYDEALRISHEVFQNRKELLGRHHPTTLDAQNSIAMVLRNQGKYEKALKIHEQVYEKRKKVLGPNDSDSLKALRDIATVTELQGKYNDALKFYEEVFNLQKENLGSNDFQTLNTQMKIANLFCSQEKWVLAFRTYEEGFHQIKALLGSNHPLIRGIIRNLKYIDSRLQLQGNDIFFAEIINRMQKDIFIAADCGDIKSVQDLLNGKIDVNINDAYGRTPIHHAAYFNHKEIVNILLEKGADVTKTTIKGNTSLHSAVSKGNKEIVELLLTHLKQKSRIKFTDFICAQTALSGSTPLHIAAKNGDFEVVECLLKHGAIYDAADKIENKSPLDYSGNPDITHLLSLIHQLFDGAKTGNNEMITRLRAISSDKFQAAVNSCNAQGQTLVQVALINKHTVIAQSLIEMLKNNEHT